MTAQACDVLIHRGERLALATCPLEVWRRKRPTATRLTFAAPSTALWRGYIATWEIVDGHLTLVDIDGAIRHGDGLFEATVAGLFPRRRGPVVADWFSGDLRCPEGRMRAYAHHGFLSEYERDRIFWISRGVVEREYLVHNPPPPLVYDIEANGSRVYLGTLPGGPREGEPDPFGDGPVEPWTLWGKRDWGYDSSAEGYVAVGTTLPGGRMAPDNGGAATT